MQLSQPWPALARDIARRLQAGASVRIIGETVEIRLPGHSLSWTALGHYQAALRLVAAAEGGQSQAGLSGLLKPGKGGIA